MKSPRRSKADLRAVCGQVHPDDAIDPRRAFSRENAGRDQTQRRAQQLCKQAFQAVAGALAGECSDPLLQDVEVVSLTPAPNAGRLLLSVRPRCGDSSAQVLLERLKNVRGFLRSRIAEAITRRRVPDLVFHVLPCEGVAR